MQAAGMSEQACQSLRDQRIPLDKRWAAFKPYWQQIRWGTFARASLLAAQRFYGCDEINDDTYEPLSRSIQQNNTPGLYDRVLRQACHIRTALTVFRPPVPPPGLLTPLIRMELGAELQTWEDVQHPLFAPDASIRSLDDYVQAVYAALAQSKAAGAVGIKIRSAFYRLPSREKALEAFADLRSGVVDQFPAERSPLLDYMTDQIIAFSAELEMVVAVHTGYLRGDSRSLHPFHIIPFLERYPQARFDVFHLGYPWVRETLMLAKSFPNVWLNFCWTHIISQRFAVSALDEAIDFIPINKLLAFGGDYGHPVEKVYGHLVMTREDIAEVLARRVASRQMTEIQALALARRLLWQNPTELYHLSEA
jgi:uncharacterized protein